MLTLCIALLAAKVAAVKALEIAEGTADCAEEDVFHWG